MTEAPWVSQYRTAIMWAVCLDDWDAAHRLSQYPSDLTVDTISERRSEAPWYCLLAAFIRGGGPVSRIEAAPEEFVSSVKEGSYEEAIVNGRSKRLKLLSAALRAIADRDRDRVETAMDKYLSYYRKSEFPRDVLEDKVSVDGTILYYLAIRNDVPVPVSRLAFDNIVSLKPA